MFRSNDIDKLVSLITNHSCTIKAGDKVIVESVDGPSALIEALIEKIFDLGAIPILQEKRQSTMAALAKHGTADAFAMEADKELAVMKQASHFIGVRQLDFNAAFTKVPAEKMKLLLENFIKPVHYNYRNKHLNWVYLRSVCSQMIEKSGLSENAFIDYYTNAILIDYNELDRLLEPLKARMERARVVRIIGPGNTNLSLELGSFGVYKSVGRHNLPDGEIFTAPIRESVEGCIEFNIDSVYYDTLFRNIRLTFKKGKVVEAYANNSKKISELLAIDEGAKYIGEFALGVNPVITTPINDILFDEKMYGSLHLALGNAYPVADNNNRSAIHWDLILDQTCQAGGGEIYFDDLLIRKNGLFQTDDLKPLNFK